MIAFPTPTLETLRVYQSAKAAPTRRPDHGWTTADTLRLRARPGGEQAGLLRQRRGMRFVAGQGPATGKRFVG